MTKYPGGTPQRYFDTIYAGKDDPWSFACDAYELERYSATVAAIPVKTCGVVFEPACSVGVLTAMLAQRCEYVYACDVAERACAQARERMRRCEITNANIRHADAFDPWPVPRCDVLVLSEWLYYLPQDELPRAISHLAGVVKPGGYVVACHWLGYSNDHAIHGSIVHRALRRAPELTLMSSAGTENYELDAFALSSDVCPE